MQCLPFSVEDVYDRQPSIFIISGKLELLAVISSIRSRADFFNVFYGDWKPLMKSLVCTNDSTHTDFLAM